MLGECPICLDTMDNNLITTKCNHTFHKECFDLWFNYKNTCPLCRIPYYNKYKCIDYKFRLKHKIYITEHYIKFSNFLYNNKYYYNKIQKIGFSDICFFIYHLKNNKIKIQKYIFSCNEECLHFFIFINLIIFPN